MNGASHSASSRVTAERFGGTEASPPRRFGIGQPVPRKEDLRLLTGRGCYSDDVNLAGQAYAAVVRSPHAHARIRAIDTTAALAHPGVLGVLTGSDAMADGLKPIPHRPTLRGAPDATLRPREGSQTFTTPHPVLPPDRVRFAGEAVSIVIAESVAAAKEAADLVTVDYEPLPAVPGSVDAIQPGAPILWDEFSSNLCLDTEVGDHSTTDAAFARAAHIVRLETQVQRVTGVPLEPRAAVGAYDAATGRYTLHAGSGGTNRQKRELATVLGIDQDQVRVVSREVGGNFGTRNAFYPEFALICWASRRIGRPVKWTCERSEAFLTDYQGRDLYVEAELALDQEGNFLALRTSNLSNVGAYTVSLVPLTKGAGLMTSVYRIPTAHVLARAAVTNTPPTNSYRSAGRPEAMFVIERLIDLAAREHGFDRVELRRRNLIFDPPHTNPLGITYDGGAYRTTMDHALALADWEGFPARRTEALSRGRRRGLALANYIEITTGVPRERAAIVIQPDGWVDLTIGTLSSGQGHETSFAQLVTEWLGVPFERVRFIQGDTDRVPVGGGTQSGRSMRLGGIVIGRARDVILQRARAIAAEVLETSPADLVFAEGRFTVQGTDRSVSLFEVARAALERPNLPEALKGPLAAEHDETITAAGFPYGTAVCEIEVDPETGQLDLVRYAAVDDVGRAINPLILEGQAHGGIAQGVGQALLEESAYDREDGQLLAGSFMDYAMPRADMLPSFLTALSEVPSPSNPLGVRAGGEGGTTPALAVVINAIVDALAEFGVRHVEMPATPERVWRAIRDAQARRVERA